MHYIHDPFIFVQKIPLNEDVLPHLPSLEHFRLGQQECSAVLPSSDVKVN